MDDVDADLVSLVVVHRAGSNFTFENPSSRNTETVTTAVTAAGAPVSGLPILSAPVTGEVWTVVLDDGETFSTHSHVVNGGASLAQVMENLAAMINTQASAAYIAAADGELHRRQNRAPLVTDEQAAASEQFVFLGRCAHNAPASAETTRSMDAM